MARIPAWCGCWANRPAPSCRRRWRSAPRACPCCRSPRCPWSCRSARSAWFPRSTSPCWRSSCPPSRWRRAGQCGGTAPAERRRRAGPRPRCRSRARCTRVWTGLLRHARPPRRTRWPARRCRQGRAMPRWWRRPAASCWSAPCARRRRAPVSPRAGCGHARSVRRARPRRPTGCPRGSGCSRPVRRYAWVCSERVFLLPRGVGSSKSERNLSDST